MTSLAAAYLAGRDAPPDESEALERVLADKLAQARATHPAIQVDADVFARHLGERADATAQAAGALIASDLYLACACLAGDERAHEVFQRDLVRPLWPAVARIVGETDADDVLSAASMRLLVGEPGASPRLATYSGHGSLGGWVRIAALRIAVSARAAKAREVPIDAALMNIVDSDLRELSDETRSDGPLAEAVRAAFAAQSARTRALLRLYYVDDRSVREIALVYRVHASTVARRLADARQAIADAAYAELQARLRLTQSETDELLGLAPDLDVTLRSLLSSTVTKE